MADTKEEVLGIDIRIKFQSTHYATMTINGRELEVRLKGTGDGCASFALVGVKEPETSSTVGGLIARKLFSPLTDILQAWMPDSMPDRPPECWEKLPEEVAGEIEEKME